MQADITSLRGYDGRFNTVIDSTLFHSLPVEGRDGYLRSVQQAAAPGASYCPARNPVSDGPTAAVTNARLSSGARAVGAGTSK
ncbi:hypothetical protein MBRA_18340 [Mycobacterium branderi]|uniref:Uncharacterized protein n=1 Tax=Mycobacterium branderi TaxID=43348 RepID=A0ABM7KKJ0_9MYCO|nr:hypothetical protein MBRA_18340 [Mycobacterium branderi]